MYRHLLSFLLLSIATLTTFAHSADPVAGLLSRILPNGGDAQRFEYHIVPTISGKDYFTLSCDGRRIRIVGNAPRSVATGVQWFLQRKLGIDISWNNPTDRLPARLPIVPAETHRAKVDVRYYLNFCTHSYTMAFWDWERWQQEIDWMALHGVTMPLIITGMESVWREMLTQHYGYRQLSAVNEFVAGGAYYGWFFMNNMTSWGGPQPASWYDQRTALARRIFRRLDEYGMEPLIPGYVGMVPGGFLQHATRHVEQWKPQDIVGGGLWCAFERPHFVNDTTRLQEMAAAYYQAVERLYGDVLSTHHYAIDPFHEGSVPRGASSARASIRAMWQALTAYDPEAVWVAQH